MAFCLCHLLYKDLIAQRTGHSGAPCAALCAWAEPQREGNLSIPENLIITWPYTERTTVRPHHRETNVYSHTFWLVWEPRRKLIAHQCCDQLTTVKTGYPLTSITWPYRGLKCQPIEVEYFLKLSADKLPVSNDRRLKFVFSNDLYQICFVYVTMAPHY